MVLDIRAQQLVHVASTLGPANVVRSLAAHYPTFAALEPEVQAELVTRAGLDAIRHDLCTLNAWERYAAVAFLLGCDFDRDPFQPWAWLLLHRRDLPAAERAERLHAECVRTLDRVAGSRAERLGAALLEVGRLEVGELVALGSGLAELEPLARRVHPAKAEDGGSAALAKLVEEARRASPTEPDVPIVFLAMFLLGVGVLRDPRYAWLGRALAEAPGEPPARQAAVLGRVKAEIERALAGA